MCGIVGAVAIEGPLDPRIRAALSSMATAIAHRGPDAEGFFTDDWAALGHRRLSIIDRAGGGQPLSNEDGSRWIVFNGEIYNHRGLRAELVSRGHRFRTVSDTETILHGYEEFGTAVLDRLEGMFAFAIYSAQTRETFIARDRLGKKPLFYATLGGALHFASEIKALQSSPAWDGALDLTTLEEYLSLGYILAPRTVYRHVRKLEPGHWLRVANGRCEVRQYWDVPVFDTLPSTVDAVAALEPLLRGAVEERLESEVPLGAFLSGGIDSGLVVSYMAEAMSEPVITTSVGFAETGHNELDAAAITANHFHTRHHAEVMEPSLDDVLDRIVGGFDEPFADASAIPTYYVSQMARRHVTVALSGDGGDESFGGYSFRYVPHALEQYVRRYGGGSFGQGVFAALGRRWPRDRRLPRLFRIGTLLENVGRDPASAYFFDLCFVKPNVVRSLMGLRPHAAMSGSPVYEAVTEPYRRCTSKSVVQRAMYADLKVYLPNDVLVKVDRMSMQHGLEVRCPLLDRRIVEWAFTAPEAVKMPRLRPKHLLRSVAMKRLPPGLLRLPKHGFSAPVGEWIARTAARRFQDEVLGAGSSVSRWLDVGEIRSLFERHRSGARDHSSALWAIWMLERWARNDSEARRTMPS
ncbi:MAG: asparagine synthase (glutamine-hydrolyzing) [Vicinamibacterales bacterium]